MSTKGDIGGPGSRRERRRTSRAAGRAGEAASFADVTTPQPPGVDALRPVLETALDAVVLMRPDGTVLDWSARAESVFGWARDEALGREMAELIIPERLRAAHRAGLRRVVAGGPTHILGRTIEITALRRDGSEFPVELSVTRPALAEGRIFLGFIRDISVRKRDETALRNAERRLQATQDHADIGIAEVDASGRYLRVNPAFRTIAGLSEAELLRMTFLEITHPEDRAEDGRLFTQLVAGELDSYTVEKRYSRRDGREIWVSVTTSSVRDDDGGFLFGVRVLQDITERRAAEQRQKLLMEELNHRVKNTLAVVLSIATQTGRHTADFNAFRQAFTARIQALAKAHELLTRQNWEGVQLRDLLEAELGLHAFRRGQVRLSGPPVWLDSRSAVDLGLVAHELATNAAKHGALSAAGTLEASWSLRNDEGRREVRLRWRERGGPPVRAPGRRGFGSTLINALVRGNLGGDVVWRFEPDGVRVEIVFQPESLGAASPIAPSES